MTQRTDGQLEKVNVRLWCHDLDWLKEHYPDNYNAQIRRIVGNWIIHARRKGESQTSETQ